MKKIKTLIMSLFFYFSINIGNGAFGIEKVNEKIKGYEENGGNISSGIQGMLTYFLGFLGLIATIIAIKGGIEILTAASDEEKVKHGKKSVLYAMLGLFIIWISYAIVSFFTNGVNSL